MNMNTVEIINRLEWKKCPSATTGGKPFFFYARAGAGYTVAWSRKWEMWEVTKGTLGEHLTYIESEKKGMEFAERYVQTMGWY